VKKLSFLIAILLFLTFINGDEIDELLKKIRLKRESSIDKSELVNTYSPLPKVKVESNRSMDSNESGDEVMKKSVTIEPTEFKLKAILNNSVFLNDRWVKLGDKIEGYELVDIMEDSILLQDGNRTKIVLFNNKNPKIKIIGRER
jgi:hypothetical protein